MDNFLPFLDLFRGQTQIEVNKSLLETFAKYDKKISDPIIINTMFSVAKTVHDSINALSFADEIRQISRLISKFMYKMDFGRDVEKNLNFYVECRRAFANLDAVKANLVRGAITLAVKTHQLCKGKHNRESSAFVRACIAFSIITIPSMESVFSRLYLYVISAEVALLNQSLPQADSLVKAAITLLQEVPAMTQANRTMTSTEPELVSFLKYFIALLVAVPGHPEHGPFYLLHGLIKVIEEYEWSLGSTARAEIYLSILALLAASYQKELPYHWPKVESNDVLYQGTTEYTNELKELIEKMVTATLNEINKLKDSPDIDVQKKLADVIVEFIDHTIAFAELTQKSAKLISSLQTLIKSKNLDPPRMARTLSFLAKKTNDLKKAWESKPTKKETVALYEQLYKKLSEK